jgi:hypothetical protein
MASLGIMHPPATSFAYVFALESYTIFSLLMILLAGELCVFICFK